MSKRIQNTEFNNEEKYIDEIVKKMNIDDLRYLSKKYLILVNGFKKENLLDLSREMIKCKNPIR